MDSVLRALSEGDISLFEARKSELADWATSRISRLGNSDADGNWYRDWAIEARSMAADAATMVYARLYIQEVDAQAAAAVRENTKLIEHFARRNQFLSRLQGAFGIAEGLAQFWVDTGQEAALMLVGLGFARVGDDAVELVRGADRISDTAPRPNRARLSMTGRGPKGVTRLTDDDLINVKGAFDDWRVDLKWDPPPGSRAQFQVIAGKPTVTLSRNATHLELMEEVVHYGQWKSGLWGKMGIPKTGSLPSGSCSTTGSRSD
jgi:hypothetical protein